MRLSRANMPLASGYGAWCQALSGFHCKNLAPHFPPGFINLQYFCHSRWRNPGRLSESAGLADWDGCAASWNDLGVDAYMADGGRSRRRRFGVFRAAPVGIIRKPHQPHYQSRDYNPLNGGVERWFEPVTETVAG